MRERPAAIISSSASLPNTALAGGFDPARDIEAIAVNRCSHGYANSDAEANAMGDAHRALREILG